LAPIFHLVRLAIGPAWQCVRVDPERGFMERELKLEIETADIKKLRATPALASFQTEPPHLEQLTSIYFDTADLYLHRRGVSLRTRAAGEVRRQTLKDRGIKNAGLYQRAEYETAVNSDLPDLAAMRRALPPSSGLSHILEREGLAAALKPIFATRVQRTIWLLQLPQGADIEFALDQAVLEYEGQAVPFQEVELELKRGEIQHLYGLALELLRAIPLRLSYRSKGDRGYALIASEHRKTEPSDDSSARAVKAQPLKLKKRDSAKQALKAMVQNCLSQIQGNESGVVLEHDAGSIHQMRVGLRRLRSAFDLMKPWINAPSLLREELRWIAGELGHARDWYVLADVTLPATLAQAEGAEIDLLHSNVKEQAKLNTERAARAAGSARYARLMLELLFWLERLPASDGESAGPEGAGVPLKKIAAKVLRHRHRKLIQRGRHLADLDVHTRHRARIAAKKLRYATEFFASLYPKRTMHRYCAALSKLQDDLGWRNDAVAADLLLNSIISEQPRTQSGAHYVRGFLAARTSADHSALKVLWKRFKRLSYVQ
jgi:triphosphatase